MTSGFAYAFNINASPTSEMFIGKGEIESVVVTDDFGNVAADDFTNIPISDPQG